MLRMRLDLHMLFLGQLVKFCLYYLRVPGTPSTMTAWCTDTCIQSINYVTRKYGHAIVAFDENQEELFTKERAHQIWTGGRAIPTVDCKGDMNNMGCSTMTASSDSFGC